jgi:hypothetical protein
MNDVGRTLSQKKRVETPLDKSEKFALSLFDRIHLRG